ncbi:MAG: VWA domain-containing protein [Gammaproteobacteria bacterium]|nr:VWA domain-containing protein [Gammaproteobacteria bacterium]
MRRRQFSVFGLSFLDVMFCGFGSVILLVMIVNAETVERREELHRDLRGEVDRLEREVRIGEEYLVELRTELESVGRTRAALARAAAETRDRIGEGADALARAERAADERGARIESLESTLGEMQSRVAEVERERREQPGERVRRFVGSGDRQYLTGLRMGGEHIVILVDASASMLAETVVEVIITRNQSDARKRAARKWRRAVATVEWLVSQLPRTSRFRILAFNVAAQALPPGAPAAWIEAGDAAAVERAVQALEEVVPADGTSLHHAFAAVRALTPRPDNLYLVTDGLPTQGERRPPGTTSSAAARARYFQSAVNALPAGVPVNTILLPMEGDPQAAAAFWRLAAATDGALITPSRDWP